MTKDTAHTPDRLTDAELAFQTDPENWRYGPTFDIRFFFSHDLDFADFERALRTDPLCISDPRFDEPSRVLLRDDQWPTCVGAMYYDFQRPDRREPNVVLYPHQYGQMKCGAYLSDDRGGALRTFLDPLMSLAERIKTTCNADEAMLFLEDDFPEMTAETEVRPGVFLAERLLRAME